MRQTHGTHPGCILGGLNPVDYIYIYYETITSYALSIPPLGGELEFGVGAKPRPLTDPSLWLGPPCQPRRTGWSTRWTAAAPWILSSLPGIVCSGMLSLYYSPGTAPPCSPTYSAMLPLTVYMNKWFLTYICEHILEYGYELNI